MSCLSRGQAPQVADEPVHLLRRGVVPAVGTDPALPLAPRAPIGWSVGRRLGRHRSSIPSRPAPRPGGSDPRPAAGPRATPGRPTGRPAGAPGRRPPAAGPGARAAGARSAGSSPRAPPAARPTRSGNLLGLPPRGPTRTQGREQEEVRLLLGEDDGASREAPNPPADGPLFPPASGPGARTSRDRVHVFHVYPGRCHSRRAVPADGRRGSRRANGWWGRGTAHAAAYPPTAWGERPSNSRRASHPRPVGRPERSRPRRAAGSWLRGQVSTP